MTPAEKTHPSVEHGSAGRFPDEAEFATVWRELLEESRAWQRIDCAAFLQRWCGHAPEDLTRTFTGVNHIGVYLGDYLDDDELFAWTRYLDGRRAEGEIRGYETGPSYIAPRQYGTPGWWVSITLEDGGVIETFTCRRFGPWQERGVEERQRLMSHVAIEVGSPEAVRAVLDSLDGGSPDLESIAYTEGDDVGHTYGHVRNNTTQAVLEIVYDQAKPAASVA